MPTGTCLAYRNFNQEREKNMEAGRIKGGKRRLAQSFHGTITIDLGVKGRKSRRLFGTAESTHQGGEQLPHGAGVGFANRIVELQG